jgi:hypothetical protein
MRSLGIAVILLLACILSSAEDLTTPTKVIDIHSLGYRDKTLARDRDHTVLALHGGTVALGFLDRVGGEGLVTRDSAFKFRVISLDLNTEKILGKQELAARDNSVLSLHWSHDGKLLIQVDDYFLVTSKELVKSAEQEFTGFGLVSSDGDTLLLATLRDNVQLLKRVRIDSLETVDSCQRDPAIGLPFSHLGDRALFLWRGKTPRVWMIPSTIRTGKVCGGLNDVLRSSEEYLGIPFFLNTDLFILQRRSIRVMSFKGKESFHRDAMDYEMLLGLDVANRSRDRFVVAAMLFNTSGTPTELKLQVYGNTRGRPQAISIKPPPKVYPAHGVSPDGNTVAVFADGVVRIFQLAGTR